MGRLPQLADTVFLTDSGLETDLIFHHGYDLPPGGYRPAQLMTEEEAQRYHSTQIVTFAGTDADLVTEG